MLAVLPPLAQNDGKYLQPQYTRMLNSTAQIRKTYGFRREEWSRRASWRKWSLKNQQDVKRKRRCVGAEAGEGRVPGGQGRKLEPRGEGWQSHRDN